MKVSPLMFMVGVVLVLQLIILLVLVSKKNTKEGFAIETEDEKNKRERRENADKTCKQQYLTMGKNAFENLNKTKQNNILTNINNCRKARKCEGLSGKELKECNTTYDGDLTLDQISSFWG